MEDRDVLTAHMDDLAARAAREGSAASRFLTPAEAERVRTGFSHRRDVRLVLDGGFEGAERVRAVFLNTDWGEYRRAELLAAIKIDYRRQDKLTHRNILGALMALGFERDAIGDIAADTRPALLVCLPVMAAVVVEGLDKIGRVGVKTEAADLSSLPAREEKLEVKTDTVASPRLDSVLCAAFDLPRGKAGELITAGRVSLNHEPCVQPARELHEGALISVRGAGRARLLEIGGKSKKGRIFIKIGLFTG